MTQLKTISNNHMSLQCRCGHSKLVSVKELIGRLSPTASIYEVARKAKCSHCGTKGELEKQLDILKERVLYGLKEKAHANDANAVVAIDIDISTVTIGQISMLMLVASGTAVVIE